MLLRPDTYVGSVERDRVKMFVMDEGVGRMVEQEAEFVRASGVPFPPEEGDLPDPDADGGDEPEEESDSDDPTAAEKAHLKALAKRESRRSAMWYLQRHLARQTRHDGPRHDYIVQVKSNGDIVLSQFNFSQQIKITQVTMDYIKAFVGSN